MGVRGKRQGNPWGCGEGFPCGFPRSGRRLDVFNVLPSAGLEGRCPGRSGRGVGVGAIQCPHGVSRGCAGCVRAACVGVLGRDKPRCAGLSRKPTFLDPGGHKDV
jgi:hypothetical protein